MKESAIGKVISAVLGLQHGKSADAKKLEGWRQLSGGRHMGNFGLVVHEVCQRYQGQDGGTNVGQVNEGLDKLCACENFDDRKRVMATLMNDMCPMQA
eukprot:5724185-Pyramimonas_sp.AAC.1